NIYNVVETVRLESRHGFLFSVDHMAAFDVVEWEYIYKVLQAFGLGKFVQWIKMIYCHGCVFSSVQINGYISAPFEITRGIRQGCPLSCALYVLVSDTVLNFIRKDHLVRGVIIQGVEHKVNSFADDTNLTLENYRSIIRVLNIYHGFKAASGATLKEAKNQLLLLGSASLEEVPLQFRGYIVDKLKIYGITITAEGFEDEQNWQEVLEALNLQEYKIPTLELSLYGKIGTFMTYTLSKMWYRANLITPTPQIITKLEKVLDGYLWYPASGKHHVRKGVLKLPTEEGGIAYPDVPLRVRAIRVQTLMRRYREAEQTWHVAFDFYMNKVRNLTK
ncbi:MAG: hypothetical protein GY853_15115, partial [PVC group bacterium]|nr:hypothetical protein [PVC group bacterium]